MSCLNILLSAYAFLPNRGSEPGVGWNIAQELVKYHKVWVLTRHIDRLTIEAELNRNPVPGLQIIYYDLPGWNKWQEEQLPGVQIYYYFWQIGLYFAGQRLHREVGFDIIHHVTFVKYWSPSFLSLLPVPFIWGPIGGGEFAPKAFWQDFSLRAKVYETLRDCARWIGECDPFVRLTARQSVLANATTEDTAKRLDKIGARNIQVFSESGLPKEEIVRLAQYSMPDSSQLRFISMGRLLHWKGFHLGLRAFAQANLLDDTEYWLLGDGPEKERLQALAEKLGIAHRVKFWSKLPREEALQKLRECVALVHPSLHDSGGWVCLEAMATGRPVLCLDLGGPAIQVTHETGFKVVANTPDQAVHDLAEAMVHLAQNSQLRVNMGKAGQKRVSDVFSWEIKGKYLSRLYKEIIARGIST